MLKIKLREIFSVAFIMTISGIMSSPALARQATDSTSVFLISPTPQVNVPTIVRANDKDCFVLDLDQGASIYKRGDVNLNEPGQEAVQSKTSNIDCNREGYALMSIQTFTDVTANPSGTGVAKFNSYYRSTCCPVTHKWQNS